jgi:hypothetical protein
MGDQLLHVCLGPAQLAPVELAEERLVRRRCTRSGQHDELSQVGCAREVLEQLPFACERVARSHVWRQLRSVTPVHAPPVATRRHPERNVDQRQHLTPQLRRRLRQPTRDAGRRRRVRPGARDPARAELVAGAVGGDQHEHRLAELVVETAEAPPDLTRVADLDEARASGDRKQDRRSRLRRERHRPRRAGYE